MARRNPRVSRPHIPPQTAGNLYYVRLKTKVGIMYKLGFTALPSVEKRFSFQGNGDEALIDEVLLFVYADDAFWLEETLHRYFKSKKAFGEFSARQDMPFYKNGQSELYCEDILGIDEKYTDSQKEMTHYQMGYRPSYQSKSEKRKQLIEDMFITTLGFILRLIAEPLRFLFNLISRIDWEKKTIKPKPAKITPVKSEFEKKVERILEWIRSNKLSNSVNM